MDDNVTVARREAANDTGVAVQRVAHKERIDPVAGHVHTHQATGQH